VFTAILTTLLTDQKPGQSDLPFCICRSFCCQLSVTSHGLLFTVLHRMQTQSSNENSVSLSVKRINCDKREDFYTIRKII